MSEVALAVVGGTGVYRLAELSAASRRRVDTPWGEPSDAVVDGHLAGRRVLFLARHGEGHALCPHEINYRANLWALHALGARRVLAINSVGGISAAMAPRALVSPDQLVDYTWGREHTYGGRGAPVQHVDMGQPYDATLRAQLQAAAHRAGVALVDGGCYGATQGPRLETAAEIRRMARDGCDVVGMTGMPEAGLARELGLAYACLAVVANWAAGCSDAGEITMDEVLANMAAATDGIPALIHALVTSE